MYIKGKCTIANSEFVDLLVIHDLYLLSFSVLWSLMRHDGRWVSSFTVTRLNVALTVKCKFKFFRAVVAKFLLNARLHDQSQLRRHQNRQLHVSPYTWAWEYKTDKQHCLRCGYFNITELLYMPRERSFIQGESLYIPLTSEIFFSVSLKFAQSHIHCIVRVSLLWRNTNTTYQTVQYSH